MSSDDEPAPDDDGPPEGDPEDAPEDAPEDITEAEAEPPRSCCAIRRKVLVGILKVLPEDACGVPDSELADVMRFDLQTPSGKPVLAFKFCPWCGARRDPNGEARITDVQIGPSGEGGGSLEG